MVISITTHYSRKIVKKKMLQNGGSFVGVIREQIKRNFSESGRPKKWARNTHATIEFKKDHIPRLILKPNMATGEMRAIATSGRIKTLKTSKGVVLKYVIPNSKSRNTFKFTEANKPMTILPFGNPAASLVTVPARPFIYISRQSFHKIGSMTAGKIEDVVVSLVEEGGKAGNQRLDRLIQETIDSYASINK